MLRNWLVSWAVWYMKRHWPNLVLHQNVASEDSSVYMRRWHLIPRNPLLNVYLHQFLNDDVARALHDHPYISFSYVFYGGYVEETPDAFIQHLPGAMIFRRAKHRHRILLYTELLGRPVVALSLFITGPRIRNWGFHCPEGFIEEAEYRRRGGC